MSSDVTVTTDVVGEEPSGKAGFRAPAGSAAVARLAAVTAELAAADTMPAVTAVAVSHVLEAVHAAVSTLMLRDGNRLLVAGQQGVAVDKARRWANFGVSDANPASEAVRTGQPVVAATADEVQQRYPRMAADTPGQRSVVCLPLKAVGDVIGVLGLTFEDNWNPGPDELGFLMTFAGACAEAIRRVRATEQATRSADRLRFLAKASAELASSLDYRTTLSAVARSAVPMLADWCAVDVLVDQQLVTLAVAHVDPAKVAWAWELQARYPVEMDAHTGAPNVVRTGKSELHAEITDAMLVASARDEEHLRLARELQPRSALVVPLTARGSVLGTITLLRTESQEQFDDADVSLAEDLGARAGVAVDNARLYDQATTVARELQRAILPESLDSLDGWQTASHYSADGHADVGGDFFDAVGLPDGRLAAFIGDVAGHGIQAAAMMAQIRSAIRAFLSVDPAPVVVVGKLDRMFEQFGLQSLVTLVYAVVSPSGHVEFVNAGHCPPVAVTPTDVRMLHSHPRPPLGARPAQTKSATVHLDPASTLLLYTDGLAERRGENLETGFARLLDHCPVLRSGSLDLSLSALVQTVAGESAQDDIAAIAVRRGSE